MTDECESYVNQFLSEVHCPCRWTTGTGTGNSLSHVMYKWQGIRSSVPTRTHNQLCLAWFWFYLLHFHYFYRISVLVHLQKVHISYTYLFEFETYYSESGIWITQSSIILTAKVQSHITYHIMYYIYILWHFINVLTWLIIRDTDILYYELTSTHTPCQGSRCTWPFYIKFLFLPVKLQILNRQQQLIFN